MPPRPLHRWKSFWLGVFVVVFIGWAWWDSWVWETEALFFADGVGMLHARGEVWILWQWELADGWSFFSGERNFVRPGAWGLWEQWEAAREFGFRISKIPHWHIILLFLLPWTTWLVWRSRRMKRLASEPGSAGLQTGSNRP
jgi:hypothetical protein